jgi:hypothetical protein
MKYPIGEKEGEDQNENDEDKQAASDFRVSLHCFPIHNHQSQL